MTEELVRSTNSKFLTKTETKTKTNLNSRSKDTIRKIEEDKKMSNKLNRILAKINFRKNYNEIEKERDTDKARFDSTFLIR